MSATQVLLTERAAMCDTFEKFGPDAPTLCEGWTTLNLAAHLPRGRQVDVLFSLELDSFQGQDRVRARLRDLRPKQALASLC